MRDNDACMTQVGCLEPMFTFTIVAALGKVLLLPWTGVVCCMHCAMMAYVPLYITIDQHKQPLLPGLHTVEKNLVFTSAVSLPCVQAHVSARGWGVDTVYLFSNQNSLIRFCCPIILHTIYAKNENIPH